MWYPLREQANFNNIKSSVKYCTSNEGNVYKNDVVFTNMYYVFYFFFCSFHIFIAFSVLFLCFARFGFRLQKKYSKIETGA